jgi:hypothetical protein
MKNKRWWVLFTVVISIGILATIFDVIKIEFWGRNPQSCPVVLPVTKELGPDYSAPIYRYEDGRAVDFKGPLFKELW